VLNMYEGLATQQFAGSLVVRWWLCAIFILMGKKMSEGDQPWARVKPLSPLIQTALFCLGSKRGLPYGVIAGRAIRVDGTPGGWIDCRVWGALI
jgi:hypothetical protein